MSSHFREYHHLACKPERVAGTFSTGCRNDLPLAEEHLPGGTGGVHYAHGFAGSDKDCSSFFSQESHCGVVWKHSLLPLTLYHFASACVVLEPNLFTRCRQAIPKARFLILFVMIPWTCGKAMMGWFSWFTRKLDKNFQSTVESDTSRRFFSPFFAVFSSAFCGRGWEAPLLYQSSTSQPTELWSKRYRSVGLVKRKLIVSDRIVDYRERMRKW